MRDFLVGDNFDVDILNSSGFIVEDFSHSALSNYESETFFFTESLSGYSTGTYTVKVSHDGKTYNHYFTIGCPASLTLSSSHTGDKGYISGDFISSTATISGVSTNDVLYQAENYVKLNAGFQASMNCTFQAEIDDCTIDGLKVAEEQMLPVDPAALQIFPNPNFGIFSVQFSAGDISDIEIIITNSIGQTIYQSGKVSVDDILYETIDMSSQPKGIYFVKLHHKDGSEMKQVVLQ
jgi:hypothetical protein